LRLTLSAEGSIRKERPTQPTFLAALSGRIILTTLLCASRFALVIACVEQFNQYIGHHSPTRWLSIPTRSWQLPFPGRQDQA